MFLGYTGSGREELAKLTASRCGMRYLSSATLASAYKEIFFGDKDSEKGIPSDYVDLLLGIAEVYRGNHLVLDNMPRSSEEAKPFIRLLDRFDRGIDFVFFIYSTLEDTVVNLTNGNSNNRQIIISQLNDEKKRILEVGRFFDYLSSYVLKRNGEPIGKLEGRIIDIIDHREFPVDHTRLPC